MLFAPRAKKALALKDADQELSFGPSSLCVIRAEAVSFFFFLKVTFHADLFMLDTFYFNVRKYHVAKIFPQHMLFIYFLIT